MAVEPLDLDIVGRIPPHSVEAEQSVIAAMLTDNKTLVPIANIVSPDDFYRSPHRLIFEAALKLIDKREPVDIITVSEILADTNKLDDAGGRSYIMQLAASHITSANAEHHANIVRNKALIRKIIYAGAEIYEAGFTTDDAYDAMGRASEIVLRVTTDAKNHSYLPAALVIDPFLQTLHERIQRPVDIPGLSTGFREFDRLVGGLQNSDFIVLAARPSMGKTALMLNMAENISVEQKKPGLIYSLEMSKDQLISRIICSRAGVDNQSLRTGKLSAEEQGRVNRAAEEIRNSPLFIYDESGLSPGQLMSVSRQAMLDTGGDLAYIFIDYLQLMEDDNARGYDGNRVQEVSKISRRCKVLARELNIPVLALSQLSRAVELRQDKVPILSDLRESGSIEQDADLVSFLYREEYYNKETPRQRTGDWIVAKQRNGPLGKVELLWNPTLTKYMNPVGSRYR